MELSAKIVHGLRRVQSQISLKEISLRVRFQQHCKLCTVRLELRLKGISRNFCYFTKKLFHHRRSASNFEKPRDKQRKNLRWSQFSAQLQVSNYTAQIFKENSTKDAFMIIFQNFHKRSFSKIFLEMYKVIFIEAFS